MSREPEPTREDDGTWNAPVEAQRARWHDDKKTQHETIPHAGQTTPTPAGDPADRPSGEAGETPHPGRDHTGEWDSLPPPIFEVGRVVFGKYRLLDKIGSGGMGDVWRVWHIDLETERALKLIKAEIAQNDKGWIRFKREAQLMAKINHDNAVAVYDFKRTHSMAYIEMEFVRGASLQDILREHEGEPMSLEWTAQVVEQLCGLLQEAHGHTDPNTGKSAPIIHRDLKPSNLMLVERKDHPGEFRLKVLDFGIAKMIEEDGVAELTGAGDLVGTPAYMSPEQIKGEKVDRRSDLYSCGVVLYHLLAGTLPFRGNKMALLAAHLDSSPLPMKEANPKADVPPAVEAVVMQCLEKDPAQRPQTARELGEKFRKAAGRMGPGHIGGPPPPPPWVKFAAGLAAALVVALGVRAFWPPHQPENRPGASPNTSADPTNIGPPIAPDIPKGPKPRRTLWVPAGYEVVDRDQTVAESPNLPKQLKRKADRVVFSHFRNGLYLPGDYTADPADPDDLVGKWPRVIVRTADKARFIRIAGATYKRGDPRPGNLDIDERTTNVCTPHFVRIPGFYIQETEVTNGEIEQYITAAHPEEKPQLERWGRAVDLLTKGGDGISPIPADAARRYPALCVDYPVAARYATSVSGLLPTEAQWEYAAKSCNEENWFPWGGKTFTDPSSPAKASLRSDDAPNLPMEVKCFGSEGQDRTMQGVYDMAGNARELCVDEYRAYKDLDPDQYSDRSRPLVDLRELVEPKGRDAATFRVVVRGGSFFQRETKSMAFHRSWASANEVDPDVGFRVVIECPDANEQPAENGK
jgi:serine/threonine-protein kinase